jgi:PAS domain S-box-containing protein
MDDAFRAAANIQSVATKNSGKLHPFPLAWVPLPPLFVAIIALRLANIQTPSETPGLFIAINFIFTTVPFLGIAYLFLRSFLATGAPGVVLFSCGALLWSVSGFAPLATYLVPSAVADNIHVTIHNLLIWAAALNILAGAALLHRGWPPIKERKRALLAAYGLTLAGAAYFAFAALQGWTPVFFIQGQGATLERQFVLGSAIFAILLTLSLLRKGISLRSAFLDWFALALMLLAIGCFGIMLQTTAGGVLGWVACAARYCGGAYMLVAAYVAFRDSEPAFLVLKSSEEQAPHRYSVAITIVLIATFVRLAFLQALGTQAIFITFYPAVILAALYGGLRAGALATLLAALIPDYFWIEPGGSFIPARAGDWLALAIFTVNCLLISWIVELLQRAEARLRRSEKDRRADLERMVAERTAALGLANEAKTRLLAAATASESELQAVFDVVPAGIWITRDPSCETMQGNRIGNAWMRIAEGTNASKSAPDPSILRFEVFDKDGLPVPNDRLPMQRAGCGEEVMDYEFEWRFPDGESRSLYGNATPLRDAGGNVTGAVAAFIDITGRKRAEAALRESEERLQAVLDASPDPIFMKDLEGRQVLANPATFAAIGKPAEACLGKTDEQFLDNPTDGRAIMATDRRIMASGQAETVEEMIFTPFGTRYFVCNKAPFRDAAGTVIGLIGTARDVTERKQAEAALRESEERLRHLGDSLPDSAVYRYSHDAGGKPRFHYISAGIEQLNGVRAEDVLRDADVLHRQILPDYLPKLIEAELVSARDLADFEMELPMRRPGGELRWMRLQSRPHRAQDGSVIWDGVQTDITERKRTEAALRESEERFRGIFEHAATGISITDLEYRFLSGNPAYIAMLGYTEEELRAADFPDLVHPEDRAANLIELRRLVAQEIPRFEIVNRYVAKGGKHIWVHKHISLLRDAAGAPTNLIALVTDISERKRYEEHISLLMSEVNHRAKNMLALVQAIARQTAATDPQDFVERFGERVRALAAGQDLLVKAEWKGADLHELIRSQLAHFSDLIGVRIELKGPPLFISASAAQTIGMALHELATNAGKYGALSNAAGRVEVAWGVERDGARRFGISWRETGGPQVTKPCQTGFGSTVIDRMARMSLDADVDLDFAPDGLVWRLQCASGKVLEEHAAALG